MHTPIINHIILLLPFLFITNTCFSASDDFIKTSCGVTRYPELCYQTLSSYANTIQDDPLQLANAALNVTLKSAKSTSENVLKMLKAHNMPKEAGAIKDCVQNMKDSVDELQESLMMMRDLDGPDFEMKMSNIQTWVSAALTDEDTCMDGFQGSGVNGKVRDTIRKFIEKVAQLTSNALALINKIA
ncbi:21 kDa protein-like [Mercurialis annua]|uniref:21 kDa protein-like n=1 Tax=Mercurialis annua TaxID=3986 RepID=UPI00215EE993|nr:21 kDa protein-like [Mercurialis annua]